MPPVQQVIPERTAASKVHPKRRKFRPYLAGRDERPDVRISGSRINFPMRRARSRGFAMARVCRNSAIDTSSSQRKYGRWSLRVRSVVSGRTFELCHRRTSITTGAPHETRSIVRSRRPSRDLSPGSSHRRPPARARAGLGPASERFDVRQILQPTRGALVGDEIAGTNHRDRYSLEDRPDSSTPCLRERDATELGQDVDPQRWKADLKDQSGDRQIRHRQVA